MKNKIKISKDNYVKYFAYLLLLVVLAINTIYLYIYLIIEMRGWNLGDWLINYQDGGFKRRGLGGYIFLSLGDYFNIKPNYLVFVFTELLLISFLFQIFLFFKKSKNNIIGFVFLLLLPVGFLFNIVSLGAVGRKEILLLNLFAFYLWCDIEKYKYKDIIIPFLLGFITFFHELTIFYLGYFLLILKINNKSYVSYLPYIFSVLIPASLFYFFGKPINNGMTFSYLERFGIYLTAGILNFNENANLILHYKNHYFVYLEYLFPVFVSILSLLWFVKIYGKEYRNLLKYFILIFILSLPLFYLAIDWGRWINIHFMMIVLVFLYQNINHQNNLIISYNQKLFIVFFVFINSFWQMEVDNNGFRLNYFIEILLSKI